MNAERRWRGRDFLTLGATDTGETPMVQVRLTRTTGVPPVLDAREL